MLNASRRAQELHGLLRLSYATLIKSEMVMAGRAVSYAREVEAQNHEPHRRELSRDFHVNAPRTDAMYDARIKHNHSFRGAGAAGDYRVSHDSSQGLSYTKKNGFFGHA
jgi:hypothetical protein